MSSLEAGILILYFSNFSTEGWARRISLFSSRIFWSIFLTYLSKKSLVIHAFEFAILDGEGFDTVKTSRIINFTKTNGFFCFRPCYNTP